MEWIHAVTVVYGHLSPSLQCQWLAEFDRNHSECAYPSYLLGECVRWIHRPLYTGNCGGQLRHQRKTTIHVCLHTPCGTYTPHARKYHYGLPSPALIYLYHQVLHLPISVMTAVILQTWQINNTGLSFSGCSLMLCMLPIAKSQLFSNTIPCLLKYRNKNSTGLKKGCTLNFVK